MAGYLQILGTNTGDSTPSVYFFTDHASYLFNCGEAIQRICVTHRIRLARLQGVFVTRLSAHTLGGLPGMALTLAEVGLSAIRVHGPPPIVQFLRGMQCFYRPGKVDMGCLVCSNSGVVENKQCESCAEILKQQREQDDKSMPQRGNLNITPIPCLTSNEYAHLDANIKVSSVLLELPDSPKCAVCYVVQTHPTPGKFDEKKSRALGIKSNDSRKGELANGRSVEMEVKNVQGELEKRLVHPSELVGEPTCGLAFAIVDCPGPEYITALVNHSFLQSFQSSSSSSSSSTAAASSSITPPAMRPLLNQTYVPEKEPEVEVLWRQVGRANQLEVMVHMSPFEVVCRPEYKQWMASFGPIRHVMLNSAQCRQEHVFPGALSLHQRLRAVNPQVFPALARNTLDPHEELKDVPSINPNIHNFDFPHAGKIIEGALLWKYVFLPRSKAKMDTSSLLPLSDTPVSSLPLLPSPPPAPPASVLAKRKRVEAAEAAKKSKQEQRASKKANGTHKTEEKEACSMPFNPSPSACPSCASFASIAPSCCWSSCSCSSSSSPPPPPPPPPFSASDSSSPATSYPNQLASGFIATPPFPTPGLAAIGASASEPLVAFLGTGSAMPSKYRNVTGIYFNPSEGSTSGMLLDCGEGTFGQLTRMRGCKGVSELVANLACVWISHMHADHHLGLVKIVEEFSEHWQGGDRLLIIGPDKLSSWLQTFGAATHNSRWEACYRCVTCEGLAACQDSAEFLRRRIGGSLVNVPVLHCHDAWGLIITHQSGYKVVYSGDTEYCPALVEAGRGATVLIHEATMGPHMEQQAAEKRHSTITDAVRAGEDMNAERIILTHFSQRYAKMPDLGETKVANTPRQSCMVSAWTRCVYAFDLMEIRFKLLESLPLYQTALRQLFEQTNDEDTT